MELPELLDFLKAGVHFGHKISKRHPKMQPYIFTSRNGIHIFDLEKTVAELARALEFVKNVVKDGGVVLFVGTKRQAKESVKKYATECGMPYVMGHWLGGLLTNFNVLKRVIKKYIDLQRKQERGELAKYTKKEQLEFQREIERLHEIVGGIYTLETIPQALFVLDIKTEETAVREARRKKVPVIGLCDTNVNPENVDYIIPGNDDATKALDLITSLVAAAVKEGKELRQAKALLEQQKAQEKAAATA